MKTLITLFFLSFLIPCAGFQSPDDFNRDLSRIVGDFKDVIMDEDECHDLKDKAEDIADDIEELLEKSEDFSSEEISQFKQLKTEAENIEDFITVVAGVGNAFPKLTDFKEVNEKVGAQIFRLSQYEFCVDVLVIEIDEYIAYLVGNNSTKNVRLTINWKADNGSRSGKSEVGMVGKSIRHIIDNRDDSLENLIIQNITCREF